MPLLLVLFSLLTAPVQKPDEVVKWSATPPAAVAPGGVAKVQVTARMQRGWKLYAIEQPADGPEPLAFSVADGAPFQIVQKQIAAPRPRIQQDENFGIATRYYEHEATFTVPVALPPSAAAGAQRIPLQVTFQACGQNICLRPFTQKLDVSLPVAR